MHTVCLSDGLCAATVFGSGQSQTVLPEHALHAAAQVGTLSEAFDKGRV